MLTQPNILVVDDEPFNVDYLQQELEEAGYDTVGAVDGQDALSKVLCDAPDLILLDIMMPVMDGFGVLSRLKGNPSTRDIPVIVISASNDLQSVVKGIALGAEDYLPKPFEPALLHARIRSSLEKKRLRDLEQLYLKGLEREMDIAREIQQSFLPSELPAVDGWEIAAYFKAAREVAGDFYDAFLLPDGNLVFGVGDVCGKGVGAALFMTLFRSLIRATATTDAFFGEPGLKPLCPAERLQHILSVTNHYVAETHGDANMFATVFIGILDSETGVLSYANCGNEPALLTSKGCGLAALRPTGPVIGVFTNAGYSIKEIAIEKGDRLVAFTDGIPDALDNDDQCFGNERLSRLLNDDDAAPASLLEDLKRELGEFVGTAKQFDDITILAIQRRV